MELKDLLLRVNELERDTGVCLLNPQSTSSETEREQVSLVKRIAFLRSRLHTTSSLSTEESNTLLTDISHFLLSSSRARTTTTQRPLQEKVDTILAAEDALLRNAAYLAKIKELSLKEGVLTAQPDIASGREAEWSETCESLEAEQRARQKASTEMLQQIMRLRDTHNVIMGKINQQFARWNDLLDAWEAQVSAVESKKETVDGSM